MKNRLIILLLFPFLSSAQFVRVNAFDTSVGKWRIESVPVLLKSAGETMMTVSLSAADTTFLLHLQGSGVGAHSIYEDDQLIFLAENDSTVTIKSPALQGYDYSKPVPTYNHYYELSVEDLEFLSRNNIHALRKYSVVGFDDVQIERKEAGKLRDMMTPFIDELKRSNLYAAKVRPVPPRFPGGNEVFQKFLNRNLKPLPLLPDEEKIAVVQFRVGPDGRIREMQVKQSAGALFDNELLRILGRMPIWKPAKKGNKEIEAVFATAFTFYAVDKKARLRFSF